MDELLPLFLPLSLDTSGAVLRACQSSYTTPALPITIWGKTPPTRQGLCSAPIDGQLCSSVYRRLRGSGTLSRTRYDCRQTWRRGTRVRVFHSLADFYTTVVGTRRKSSKLSLSISGQAKRKDSTPGSPDDRTPTLTEQALRSICTDHIATGTDIVSKKPSNACHRAKLTWMKKTSFGQAGLDESQRESDPKSTLQTRYDEPPMHQRAINAGSILSDASSQACDLKSCSIGPQFSYEEPTPTANTSKLLECTLDTRPDERRKGAIRLLRFSPRPAYVKELGKSWNPINKNSTLQRLFTKPASEGNISHPRQRTPPALVQPRLDVRTKYPLKLGPTKHTPDDTRILKLNSSIDNRMQLILIWLKSTIILPLNSSLA
ncbi:hypothetical protein HYFRA_00007963 [Hymenoscyphus fraxineus]|uniref:Uncharacterized protein n=1 Tax=Hymenoscyphus fraxineus TaxID=746836 RepID=A0A9N9PLJ8_9HELO|nr:hypothetical protein HYFRA_00007963 [Hymenoscyphus fraxineus]